MRFGAKHKKVPRARAELVPGMLISVLLRASGMPGLLA